MSGVRPGETIVDGKYRIERRIGAGGMGAVYLATHLGTSRPVALKLISSRFAADPTFVERFKREARAAGRLRHPNIVDVTDFGIGTVGGADVAYLVMEYLGGCSLEEVLAEQPKLPLRWTVDFFDQFAAAVEEAHRNGVVHRDLKPANLWLEPDARGGFRVKVLDFGLATLAETEAPALAPPPERLSSDDAPTLPGPVMSGRSASEAPTLALGGAIAAASSPTSERAERIEPFGAGALTAAGAVLGTPGYMAPEQSRGERVTRAADVFSMGVILYQMLAGRSPFREVSIEAILTGDMHAAPASLREAAPDVPGPVADLVMAALANDPAIRPASARHFAEQLRAKAESPGALIQRGLVTCFEHFDSFLRIALAVVAPQAVLVALLLVVDELLRAGAISRTAHFALWAPLWVADVLVATLGGLLARGVAVLVIAQVLLAPLREVRIQLAWDALRRYFWPSLLGATTILVRVVLPLVGGYAAISWGRALAGGEIVEYVVRLEDPSAAARAVAAITAGLGLWYVALRQWSGLLHLPSVILVESLTGRPARSRSRELARRSPRDALAVGAVTLLAPSLSILLFDSLLASAAGIGAAVSLTAAMLGVRILNNAVLPVLAGVLYLKVRQANAEPIDQLLDAQFVTEKPPETAWQRRLDIAPRRSGESERPGG